MRAPLLKSDENIRAQPNTGMHRKPRFSTTFPTASTNSGIGRPPIRCFETRGSLSSATCAGDSVLPTRTCVEVRGRGVLTSVSAAPVVLPCPLSHAIEKMKQKGNVSSKPRATMQVQLKKCTRHPHELQTLKCGISLMRKHALFLFSGCPGIRDSTYVNQCKVTGI